MSPPTSRGRRAHSASDCDLDLWVSAAERLLAPDGKLVLIHRPESIEAILAMLKGRFGAAELIPIFPRPGAARDPIDRPHHQGRRTPPIFRAGIVLNDADNQPSKAANAILRDAGPLAPA